MSQKKIPGVLKRLKDDCTGFSSDGMFAGSKYLEDVIFNFFFNESRLSISGLQCFKVIGP